MTSHPGTPALDIGAAGLVITSLLGYLPPLAAILGITWYCVLFYDRFFKKKKPTTSGD